MKGRCVRQPFIQDPDALTMFEWADEAIQTIRLDIKEAQAWCAVYEVQLEKLYDAKEHDERSIRRIMKRRLKRVKS